jgi:hypothetical protein
MLLFHIVVWLIAWPVWLIDPLFWLIEMGLVHRAFILAYRPTSLTHRPVTSVHRLFILVHRNFITHEIKKKRDELKYSLSSFPLFCLIPQFHQYTLNLFIIHH